MTIGYQNIRGKLALSDAKNIIELNGKRYDIRTGKLIEDSGVQHTAKLVLPKTKMGSGTMLDGFQRHKPAHRPTQSAAPAVTAKPHEAAKPSQTTHQKLQRSQTLMRPGLKKPDKLSPTPAAAHQSKLPSLGPEAKARLQRAEGISRSHFISKFTNPAVPSKLEKRHEPLAVAPTPLKAAEGAFGEVSHVAQTVEKRFERAIEQASSHLSEFPDKKSRRRGKKTNILAGTLAGLLLFGFFAFQNLPNLEMRVATARAGISAKMPGYRPAGFGMAGLPKSEPGKVAVSFRSHTDDKGYTVTQEASSWSSQTLATNLEANNKHYSTFPSEGKTVYMYDDSDAAWVDGGIHYQIEGNASLTSDQLLRIVNSF
jgi:hypothetical protein